MYVQHNKSCIPPDTNGNGGLCVCDDNDAFWLKIQMAFAAGWHSGQAKEYGLNEAWNDYSASLE